MIIWDLIKSLKLPLILLIACCFTMIEQSNVYYGIAFCIVMLPVIIQRPKLWDMNATLLLFFGFIYFFITAFYYTTDSWANEIVYLLGPFCCYLCGKLFTLKSKDSTWLTWIILLVCIAVALPIYILTIKDILGGEIIAYSRQLGGDDNILKATLYGLVAAVNLSGLGYFILSRKQDRMVFPIVFLLLFLCSFLTTIHLINRTGIVVIAVVLLAMMLTRGIASGLKVFLWVSAILVVAIVIFGNDWLTNSFEAYNSRNTVQGYEVDSAGGRFERWTDALEKFLFYPFGWWKDPMTYNDRVHNLGLDVARVAGIVPFVLIVVFFVRWIKIQIKLLRQYKQNSLVILLLGILLCMVLASSVEPVIEAKAFYFCLMLFFVGIEYEVLDQRNKFLLS